MKKNISINKNYEDKELTLIAAVSENNGLGLNNKLLWNLREDLIRFKKLTLGHSIIMGRKTFESLPNALPERKNIILTRNKKFKAQNAFITHSVNEAISLTDDDKQPFIIGGGEIYSLFIDISKKIELTLIHRKYKADTFFPIIDSNKWGKIYEKYNPSKVKETFSYSFVTYKKLI